MSTRTIKLKLLTQTGVVKVESALRTFGELKQDPTVKKLGIDWQNTKLIDKDTRATFDLDDSILPAIDCILFVTPTKTKSGADLPYKEVKQKIKEFKEKGGLVPFNYTQATTEDLNKFWNKAKSIKLSARKEGKPVAKAKASIDKMVGSLIGKKEEAKLKETIIPSIPLGEIVEVVTKEDLQKEAEEIKSLVNKRRWF
jgi:hypothetical protein